jgi:hypothetical protein
MVERVMDGFSKVRVVSFKIFAEESKDKVNNSFKAFVGVIRFFGIVWHDLCCPMRHYRGPSRSGAASPLKGDVAK